MLCVCSTRDLTALSISLTHNICPLVLAQNLRLAVGADDLIDPQITHRLTLMDIGIIDLNFMLMPLFLICLHKINPCAPEYQLPCPHCGFHNIFRDVRKHSPTDDLLQTSYSR